MAYKLEPKTSRRPSQSFTTNSRECHGMLASSRVNLHAVGCVLGIERVCIFDMEVCVEQFVRIFLRIGCGRLGAAEVNRVLVPRHDGVDGRIVPRSQTLEAKLFLVISERAGNVGGEELRCNLANHGLSVRQPFGVMPAKWRGRLLLDGRRTKCSRQDRKSRNRANRRGYL